MRILHVITALGVGGAENMLVRLVRAPALSGCEQLVVAMLPGGALAASLRAVGHRVVELDFLGGVPVLSGSARLVAVARQWVPDIVHGWMYHGNLGALVARELACRSAALVWSVHQSLPGLAGERALAKVAILGNRAVASRADRIVHVSESSRADHRRFGFADERSEVVPNGIDTQAFRPLPEERTRIRAEWHAGEQDIVFGIAGRFHPAKDHANFLRGAARVAREVPRAVFVLAGSGIDWSNAELVASIDEAGLRSQVRLLGPRDDMPRIMCGLDVYVSSSATEAFSLAIGEAMSAALPCVVTDVGDSRQMVGDAGRAVPPRNDAALASAMLDLARMSGTQRSGFGLRARERVIERYSLDRVAHRYLDIYRRLRPGAFERGPGTVHA